MQQLGRVGTYAFDVLCVLVAGFFVLGIPQDPKLWTVALAVGGGRLLVRLSPGNPRAIVTSISLAAAVLIYYLDIPFISIFISGVIVIYRVLAHTEPRQNLRKPKLGNVTGSKELRRAAQKAIRRRQPQKGTYGARWSDVADLAQANMYIEMDKRFQRSIALAAPSPNLLIGINEGHANRRELGHFAVFGATRAGKGRLVTANGILWPESLVVLDIKGENYKLTAGLRARYSRVLALHPNGRGNRYDPFRAMQGSSEGMRTAANIIIDANQDKQPVFGQTAENALYAAFLGARLEGAPTLPYLQVLLDEGIMGFVKHLASLNNREITRALTQFLTVKPAEFTLEFFERSGLLRGAWGTLNTRCSAFMTDGVMAMMGGNDFQPEDLYDDNVSLYLIFPESEAAATSKAFQIILVSLLNSLIRVYDERDAADQKPARQILWLLDEAGRTPIPHLDDYIATVAGRGMTFGLFIQDIPQLINNYKVSEKTVRSNIRTQVFYAPTEETTARYVEQRLGQHSIVFERDNIAWAGGGTIGGEGINLPLPAIPMVGPAEIVRESHRSLMTTDELYKMPLDDVIIFAAAVPPIYERRIEPFQIFNDLNDAPKAPPLKKLEPVEYTLSSAAPYTYEPSLEDEESASDFLKPSLSEEENKELSASKRKSTQENAQKPSSTPKRQTFANEREAATAALRERSSKDQPLVVVERTVSTSGMPYTVFTNGTAQVVICQIGGADCYFIATQDEIKLLEPLLESETRLDETYNPAPNLEPDLGFDDIDADLTNDSSDTGDTAA